MLLIGGTAWLYSSRICSYLLQDSSTSLVGPKTYGVKGNRAEHTMGKITTCESMYCVQTSLS